MVRRIIALAAMGLTAATAQAAPPPGQQAVCTLLKDYSARYKPLYDAWDNETNPIMKERFVARRDALRRERDGALDSLLASLAFKMESWRVKIDKISLGYEKPRPVQMVLNPHCGMPAHVEAKDIPLTPSLEDTVAELKVGQEITISGSFVRLGEEEPWRGRHLVGGVFESTAMEQPELMIQDWHLVK
jgi:hypothetical protein